MSNAPLLVGEEQDSRRREAEEVGDEEAEELEEQEERHSWWSHISERPWFPPLIAVVVAAFILACVLITKALSLGTEIEQNNIIFMVSDGMGPASLSLARSFKVERDGKAMTYNLPMDYDLIGTSRTKSSDSLVTDSAAGATAFSCGIKTYNGAVGVNPKHGPCGTVMESAHMDGYLTGLVVTSDVTDATPASFITHVLSRFSNSLIAEQMLGTDSLGRTFDLLFGGGLCRFLPQSHPKSCRRDDVDLLNRLDKQNVHLLSSLSDFESFSSSNNQSGFLPLIGLFGRSNLAFEIDRDNSTQPSLKAMVRSALSALSTASKERRKRGIFVLIEGSRIDMAAHRNDVSAHIHEVIAYNEAWKEAKNFIDREGGLLVSTSDHETGGLAVGYQTDPNVYPPYEWFPGVAMNVTHSVEYLAERVLRYDGDDLDRFLSTTIIGKGLGIQDATSSEFRRVKQSATKYDELCEALTMMVNPRARIGWSTHGHTAVDVNIYAYGDNKFKPLRGNRENTDIGKWLRKRLQVSVKKTTRLLKK